MQDVSEKLCPNVMQPTYCYLQQMKKFLNASQKCYNILDASVQSTYRLTIF